MSIDLYPALVIDDVHGCPLYGFNPDEITGRACTEWSSFIGSFCRFWENKHSQYPPPFIVDKARFYWHRYSMTGYEAFSTIENMPEKERMMKI